MDADVVVTSDLVTEGLGAFDEIEELGKGTFGTTFRVRRDDDEFAIKVIHFPNMPEYLWQREVGALQRVHHPNVVGFRRSGYFDADGQRLPYLECEFVEGGTVESALRGGRPHAQIRERESARRGLRSAFCRFLFVRGRFCMSHLLPLWGQPEGKRRMA